MLKISLKPAAELEYGKMHGEIGDKNASKIERKVQNNVLPFVILFTGIRFMFILSTGSR